MIYYDGIEARGQTFDIFSLKNFFFKYRHISLASTSCTRIIEL